jgi:3-deoxy-D-manno-octulosonate 8-phosphate phosphatase (KDO 8-P phosphatase)
MDDLDPRPKGIVRALISDVDGVWTDGGMYFDRNGQALKRFDVKDGYIVRPLQDAGVAVIWVSGDASEITRARGRKLGIDQLRLGVQDKGAEVRDVMDTLGLQPDEVVYLGDDLNDLPAIAVAGFSACPEDAIDDVRRAVTRVLRHRGGHGAVRELADLILQWNRAQAEG